MKRLLLILVLLAGCAGLQSGLQGQQLPSSHYYLFHPNLMNPGIVPRINLNQFYLGHQHRQLSGFGWGTISQFLNFKAKPFGKARNFGWGVYVNNDLEHTERRTAVGGSMAVNILDDDYLYLSTGISAGLINWGANYNDVRVYDRNDQLVMRASNFSEVDAGVGIAFGYHDYNLRTDLSAVATQLPGSLLSDEINGVKIAPHLIGSGTFLLSPFPDFYIGPMAQYRNTFSLDSTIGGIRTAFLDVGLRTDFDHQNMWFAGAYRLGNAAVTAGFGIQIIGTDTGGYGRQLANFVDLNLMASYPLNESSVFGPSVELGLTFSIGVAGEDETKIDTIGLMKGSFWVNSGNMNTHRERRLDANAPPGLYAESVVSEKTVQMTYEWDDNMYQYLGSNPVSYQDSLFSDLGEDWIGVDGILENLVHEVIHEGLTPTNQEVENPDSLEPLKDLVWVELGCRLKFDDVSADFGAEGVIYNGELGTNDESGDSLDITVDYFGRDTTVRIGKGQQITNLELACLKLHAMSMKFRYELEKYYGEDLAFVREGESILGLGNKKIVFVRTPVVIPNNPNQKPFQVSTVNLGFRRDVDWEPIKRTAKDIRRARQSKKDVRGRWKRNRYRDPVVGDEKREKEKEK